MAYEKIANLKGPKGNGVKNARVVGDNLVIDEYDGTQLSRSAVVVGNVRGPKGDKGDKGDQGIQGPLPALQAAATTTPAGTQAQAAATPIEGGARIDLSIPRGDKGDKGDKGDTGPMPTLTATASGGNPGAEPSVHVTATTGGYQIEFRDVKGPYGPAPQLEMATPLNLVNGSQPSASITPISDGVYRIQLGLVQGEPGNASNTINDAQENYQTTWSSSYIRQQINAIINDTKVQALTGWSSQKIQAAITAAAVKALPWTAITGKPETFPPAAHTHAWTEITDKPATFPPAAHTHAWAEITGKPTTFAPAAHTHTAAQIVSGTLAPALLPAATDAAQGAVELATTAEAAAGVDGTRAVTPAGVASYVTAKTAAYVPMIIDEWGGALVGAAYPGGATPLRMVTLNGVTDTRNQPNNYANIGIDQFAGGVLTVMITPVEGAVSANVAYSGGNPASTLTSLRVRFFSGNGAVVNGVVRFTMLVVGW